MACDIVDAKLAAAKKVGATVTINCKTQVLKDVGKMVSFFVSARTKRELLLAAFFSSCLSSHARDVWQWRRQNNGGHWGQYHGR